MTIGAGEDARSRLIEATGAGRDLRIEAQRAWKAAQIALNEQLGVARVSGLHALLDASIAALDEAPSDASAI